MGRVSRARLDEIAATAAPAPHRAVAAAAAAAAAAASLSQFAMSITLSVSGLGSKHTLECEPSDSIRAVKARLEPLVHMAPAEMKLIVKGKAWDDDAKTLGSMSVDGMNVKFLKVMLMKSRAGATASAAASKPAAPLPPSAAPASSAAPAPAAAAAPLGAGSIALTVAQGTTKHALLCEGATTVRELKALLQSATGAEPPLMRLLVKGKEAADASSVAELGLASGAKLMLLFRGTHHRQQEGAAAIAGGASTLADLRSRVERQRRQIEKRLASGAEALASLGALDGECEALAQDLRNAAVAPGADAAASREAQLAELASIVALLAEARAAEAKASLGR